MARIVSFSKINSNFRFIIACIIIIVFCVLFWWWQNKNYTGPIQTFTATDALIRSSTIVIPVTASLDDLQARLNEQIPPILYSINENRDACAKAKMVDFGLFKTKVSPDIDCHIDGSVTRGTIQLTGVGKNLTITMPIFAKVTVRGRGDIGKHIRETADGSVVAFATVTADINSKWEPSATVDADYKWTDRIGVDILGIRITFASHVDPKIRDAIESFKKKIPEYLAKINVIQQASKGWSKGYTIIQVAKGPDVWLRFTPSDVGYDGYNVEGRTLRFNVMASGKTETFMGARPPESKPQSLPDLKRSLPNPGFEFFVPINASYTDLGEALKAALKTGSEQAFDIPKIGSVQTVFKDVKIYQTEEQKLAVGISLRAVSPVGNADGTIWLVAAPSIDAKNKRTKIDSLEVYSSTNNVPLDLLIKVIQFEPVNQAIRNNLEYDYGSKYADLLNQANIALSRQISYDFYSIGIINNITPEYLTAGPAGLHIALSASGKLELQFGKITR
ncbi:DUF4403 family protein [Methylorubrum extorquens]